MSDNNKDLTPAKSVEATVKSGEEKKEAQASSSTSKRSIFGHLNSDLQNALNTWEDLTEQMAEKVSPEEEQLQEVKRLLVELKSKLQQFND